MPGEKAMLHEFIAGLQPKVLGQLVEVVFDKMVLAGEAGSLLRIEAELRDAIAAVKQWVSETERAVDREGEPFVLLQSRDGAFGEEEARAATVRLFGDY